MRPVAVQKIPTAVIAAAFEKVSQNKQHWNQWIVVDLWASLINDELRLADDLKVTGGQLSSKLLRSTRYKAIRDHIDSYGSTNVFGLFRTKVGQHIAFYVTDATSSPRMNDHMPGGNAYQLVTEFASEVQTRAATNRNNTTTESHLPSTTSSIPPSAPPVEERPRKRGRRLSTIPKKAGEQGRFNDGQFGAMRQSLVAEADCSNNGTSKNGRRRQQQPC